MTSKNGYNILFLIVLPYMPGHHHSPVSWISSSTTTRVARQSETETFSLSLMAALNIILSLPSSTSHCRRRSPVPPLIRSFSRHHPPPPRHPVNSSIPSSSSSTPASPPPISDPWHPPQPITALLPVLGGALLAALFAGSLLLADPAVAYKGGGPYGLGVTRGQDLSGKDFSGKTLIKQDFKTSILRQANFKGAKLLGASFFDADLTGADLSEADLRGVDLSLANLTKANLSNANLEGALVTGNTSFKGSLINGADLTDVPLREDQREYLCRFADGVNPTTGNATRDTLLCQ